MKDHLICQSNIVSEFVARLQNKIMIKKKLSKMKPKFESTTVNVKHTIATLLNFIPIA